MKLGSLRGNCRPHKWVRPRSRVTACKVNLRRAFSLGIFATHTITPLTSALRARLRFFEDIRCAAVAGYAAHHQKGWSQRIPISDRTTERSPTFLPVVIFTRRGNFWLGSTESYRTFSMRFGTWSAHYSRRRYSWISLRLL